MLLTHSILLLPGIFYGHKNLPTFHTVKDLFNTQSAATDDRITKLETMIDLDWTALWNFNQIKWESIHNDLNPCVLESTSVNASTPQTPYDPFHFHDLCATRHCVDCIHESNATVLTKNTKEEPTCNHSTTQVMDVLTDIDILAHNPYSLFTMANTTSAVIFDTGASLGITHDIQDFDGPLTIPDYDLRLGGMANGLKIEGVGPVTWTFSNKDGTEVQIRSQCYYVPQSKMRLISPQRLFNKEKGVSGWYKGDEESFRLQFDGCPCLIVEYNPRNHLPIGKARIGGSGMLPQVNFALTNE